jgi:hypothetical protein
MSNAEQPKTQKPKIFIPHPLTGYYCGCDDRITAYDPAGRINCQNAIQQQDPKLSFTAHKAYLSQDRTDPIPNRTCHTCCQPLIMDELTFMEAHQLLEVCRRIDEEYSYLTSWHSILNSGAEQVISCKLLAQLGDWWKDNDLRCIRGILNTLWKSELSGISLMIFAAVHEFCKMKKIQERKEAIRAEKMRQIADQERESLFAQMEYRRSITPSRAIYTAS